MRVIGLTGSLGTGKSTVAAMFARQGARVIDADRIVHMLLRKGGGCFAPIVRAFGKEYAGASGIKRKKLAAVVFHDEKKLRKLERIIHPQVRREIRRQMAICRKSAGEGVVVLNVPLLFESGLHRQTDMTVVVSTAGATQLRRAMKKLQITRAEALRRIKAQMPLKDKIRLADMIIDNNKTKTHTRKQVKKIWLELSQKRKK